MFLAASNDLFDKKFEIEMIELNTRTWILSIERIHKGRLASIFIVILHFRYNVFVSRQMICAIIKKKKN